MKKHDQTDDANPVSDHSSRLLPAVEVGAGRVAVTLRSVSQGRDFLVLISGGEGHVGAVATCDGRNRWDHVRVAEETVQLAGHREGPLASEAAEMLALASGRTCVAVVGIHQDEATIDEIDQIVANVRLGLGQLAAQLAGKNQR